MPVASSDVALVGHVVHGIRRALIARTAFGHGVYEPPVLIKPQHIVSEVARVTQDIVDGLLLGHEARDRICCHVGRNEDLHCPYEVYWVRKIIAPQLSLAVTPRSIAKTHKLCTAICANTDTVILTTHNMQVLHTGIHTKTGWLPPP